MFPFREQSNPFTQTSPSSLPADPTTTPAFVAEVSRIVIDKISKNGLSTRPLLVTGREAARLLGTNVSAVRRLVRDGHLSGGPFPFPGSAIHVTYESAVALVKRFGAGAGAPLRNVRRHDA
ncbi:MAG: hypothetical protein WA208_18640 [Thermoanaerobaculia bacterium]